MYFVLFSLALLFLYEAMTTEIHMRPPKIVSDTSQFDNMYAAAFLSYQAAAVQAVEDNGFNGNSVGVAIPTISGSGGTPLPGAGNRIIQNGSTVTIAVYAALSSGQMTAALTQSGGNATIGWSRQGQWVSPIYGQMGTTPLAVPDGDAVSFIALERH